MNKIICLVFLLFSTALFARPDPILFGKYIQNGSALITLPTANADLSTVTGISGTNTGDVTLGTSNGLSLAAQVLSLQLADATHIGALSSGNWSTFNSKEPAITATSSADYYGGDKAFHTLLSLPVSTATQTALNLKADISSLATVATTGAYADLTGKPTIPAAQVNSDWNSASGLSQILNKPTLATVATTGAYADLSGKPTLLSQFTNDPGYLTAMPNLTGEVTSVGSATTVTNAAIISKVLTGYTSGAGTISASDSILSSIQKLNGNIANATVNLTGPITSVGNATSVASQTGTGSTFVMSASPTITTPTFSGTATGSISGNAATVTTNANLTGPVTSVGNATTITAASVTNAMLAGSIDLTTKVTGILPAANVAIASANVKDSYSGNASTTVFTLSQTPAVSSQAQIFVNGLLQIVTTDYTISGTSLTFVTAPDLAQDIKAIYSRY